MEATIGTSEMMISTDAPHEYERRMEIALVRAYCLQHITKTGGLVKDNVELQMMKYFDEGDLTNEN